jgi:hypothetical protein
MSDVHIGKITQTRLDKGTAQLYYHVPITTPVNGVVPTPESAIPTLLDQAEKDALAAGTLVEITRKIELFKNNTDNEVVAAIKADYLNLKAEYNQRFSFENKYYGVKFNAGS